MLFSKGIKQRLLKIIKILKLYNLLCPRCEPCGTPLFTLHYFILFYYIASYNFSNGYPAMSSDGM